MCAKRSRFSTLDTRHKNVADKCSTFAYGGHVQGGPKNRTCLSVDNFATGTGKNV